jgi:hypothetical protein
MGESYRVILTAEAVGNLEEIARYVQTERVRTFFVAVTRGIGVPPMAARRPLCPE